MANPEYPVLLASIVVETGVNDTIIFNDGTADRTATITAGTYYVRGDQASGDLCAAVDTALAAAPSSTVAPTSVDVDTHDVDPDNVSASFAIQMDGAWTLKNTGTLDLTQLGYETADFPISSSGGSNEVASTVSLPVVWVSDQPYSSKEPDPRLPGTVQHSTPEGQVYTFTAASRRTDRTLVMDVLHAKRTRRERNTADPQASLEAWWELAADGRLIEFHLQSISSGTVLSALSSSTLVDVYVLDSESIARLPVDLLRLGRLLYRALLKFREYVA